MNIHKVNTTAYHPHTDRLVERFTVPPLWEQVDLDSYKSELVSNLADAWKNAQEQKCQKTVYDRLAKPPSFRVGDRVFLSLPAAKSNKAYQFAKRFQGPYCIVCLYNNGAERQPVDHPRASPICVSMDRLWSCPTELAGMPTSASPCVTQQQPVGGGSSWSTKGTQQE